MIGSVERAGGFDGFAAEFRGGAASAGRTGAVAEAGSERLTSVMAGWIAGGGAAFDPPELPLTSWIGGKSTEREAVRPARGAGASEVAALGAVGARTSRPDALSLRRTDEAVFLAGGARRATVGVAGASGFGAAFATGGALVGTAAGADTVYGSTADGAALALFATVPAAGGVALAVFSRAGLLAARVGIDAGADRSTTAGARPDWRDVAPIFGGAVVIGRSVGSISLGESASSGASAVGSVSGFATGSPLDSTGDWGSAAVSAMVSPGVAAGISSFGSRPVASADRAVASAPASAAERSGGVGGSAAGGVAAMSGVAFTGAADSVAGVG